MVSVAMHPPGGGRIAGDSGGSEEVGTPVRQTRDRVPTSEPAHNSLCQGGVGDGIHLSQRSPRADRHGATMELRHLDVLLAVAEQGSFTAAADTLRTVQSNVSEQVRQLEAELGVPLIVRNRRGALPTEFGVRVLERAR